MRQHNDMRQHRTCKPGQELQKKQSAYQLDEKKRQFPACEIHDPLHTLHKKAPWRSSD